MEWHRQLAAWRGPVLRRYVTVALVLALVSLGLIDAWYERRKERRFDPAIIRVSRQHGVDPALVKALVWRESKFNPKARGRAGEVGLMQIRSLAAEEWAASQTRRPFDGTLFNPETNLQVGTWYLAKLLRRYAKTDNAVVYALADYNAGRSNVLRWNKGLAETNSSVFFAQITFPGTREYVRTITQRRVRYYGKLETLSSRPEHAYQPASVR